MLDKGGDLRNIDATSKEPHQGPGILQDEVRVNRSKAESHQRNDLLKKGFRISWAGVRQKWRFIQKFRISQRTGLNLADPSESVSQSARSRLKADGGCRAASYNCSGAAHFVLNSCIYIRIVTNVKNLRVGKPFRATK
jgi:hypothetical protein